MVTISMPWQFIIPIIFFMASLIYLLIDISRQCSRIIKGQRLSVYLNLSPKSLKINMEQFEADKSKVKARLMERLEGEKHPNADTLAYCILNHSGWDAFVDSETRLKARRALARLLINDNRKAVTDFLEEIVDQL